MGSGKNNNTRSVVLNIVTKPPKMPFTNETYLPSYEELTVPEIEITSSVFRAAAHHMGKYCDEQSKEFMLCRAEDQDPRKCINEGKEVTRCGFEFLRKCRVTQKVFDDCVKENLGQDRPELGYFSKVRVHDAKSPKTQPVPHILPDRLPELPEDMNADSERKKVPGSWHRTAF